MVKQLPEAKKELSNALDVQYEIDQLKEAIMDLEGRATKKRDEVKKLESGSSYRSEKERKSLQRKISGLESLENKIKENEPEGTKDNGKEDSTKAGEDKTIKEEEE